MSTTANSPRKPVVLAVLSVLAVFAAGIALGILADRVFLYLRHDGMGFRGGPPPARVARWLDHRLHLDDAQRASVKEILERRRSRFHEITIKNRPEVEALRDSTTAEIRAVLRPDQREKYDRILSRIEGLRARRGRAGPLEGGRLPY